MTGVENVGVFIWETVWLENGRRGITQKKACNKQYPVCLTILTMMGRHLVFDTPVSVINPLNAELNPICHLLASLGAHLILHVSRIRVNSVLSRHFVTCRDTLTL